MALGTPVVAPVRLRLMLRWEAVSTEAAEEAGVWEWRANMSAVDGVRGLFWVCQEAIEGPTSMVCLDTLILPT